MREGTFSRKNRMRAARWWDREGRAVGAEYGQKEQKIRRKGEKKRNTAHEQRIIILKGEN